MDVLLLILCAVVGYLLGNIQTGLIIGRVTENVDLRKHGSGSSGATNALRVLGRQSALFTLMGDCAKGMLATGVGLLIGGWYGGLTGALFAVIGHIWPVFFDFKGGKGAATSLGVLILLMPWHTLGLIVVGVVVILLTHMVSLGSIAGALFYLVTATLTAITRQDWFLLVFNIIIAAIVIFAHRANIVRILNGTENKLNPAMLRRKKK